MQDGKTGEAIPFYKSPIFLTAIGIGVVHGYAALAAWLKQQNIIELPAISQDPEALGNIVVDALTAAAAWFIAHRRAKVTPNKPPPAIEPVSATVVRLTGGTVK